MARGIQIPFTLDVREWRRGMRMVELDLEDLGDEFKDLERDADRYLEGIEDSFKDVGDAAERAGRDAQDGLSDGLKGQGRVGAIGSEVAEEFTQNFGEAIRSGNPADAILETFTSLGPALGVLGIGSALVAGIINGINEEKKRLQDALKSVVDNVTARAVEAADEQGASMIREFNKGVLSEATKVENLMEFYGVDTMQDALIRAQEDADALGVKMVNVVDAIGATGKEQQKATDQIGRAVDRAEELRAANQNVVDAVGNVNAAMQGTANRANKALDAGRPLLSQAQNLTAEWRRTKDAVREFERELDGANGKVSALAGNIRNLPDLDIGITQRTANALAARAKLVNE